MSVTCGAENLHDPAPACRPRAPQVLPFHWPEIPVQPVQDLPNRLRPVVGREITIETSTGVTVFDNRARNNTGLDINWDGSGGNKFDGNACNSSTPTGACAK